MKQYIDKSIVVAEIKKRRSRNSKNKLNIAATFEDNYLLSFLDTLEVKEVDININNEISKFIDDNFKKATIGHKLSLRRVAKHFFELGLKMKGGEE